MILHKEPPNYLLGLLILVSLALHLILIWPLARDLKPRQWVYIPVRLSTFAHQAHTSPPPAAPRAPSSTPVPIKAQRLRPVPQDALPIKAPAPPPAPPAPKAPSLPQPSTKPSPLVSPQEIESAWQEAQGRFNRYVALIRARIERAKRYPLAAREMGLQGESVLRFVLSPNGELIGVELLRSSGVEILDKAALSAVKKAAPFPPPPPPFDQRKQLTFVVTLRFYLK